MFNRAKFFEYVLKTYLTQGSRFTQGQVYRILYELHAHGLLFHLDDNPEDVGNSQSGDFQPIFTVYEAAVLRAVQPGFFSEATLPDFGGDPHEICVDLTRPKDFAFSSNEPGSTRTLPRWGFSFDDEANNSYVGFTEPRTWNGWGCPLLSFDQLQRILIEGGYSYDINHREYQNPALNHSVFRITGTPNDPQLDPSDYILIEGEFVLTPDGSRFCVYDTSPLGLCFNVDDCQEKNPHDWEGYL